MWASHDISKKCRFWKWFPQRQGVYVLQSPPTGANNIVATYSSVF